MKRQREFNSDQLDVKHQKVESLSPIVCFEFSEHTGVASHSLKELGNFLSKWYTVETNKWRGDFLVMEADTCVSSNSVINLFTNTYRIVPYVPPRNFMRSTTRGEYIFVRGREVYKSDRSGREVMLFDSKVDLDSHHLIATDDFVDLYEERCVHRYKIEDMSYVNNIHFAVKFNKMYRYNNDQVVLIQEKKKTSEWITTSLSCAPGASIEELTSMEEDGWVAQVCGNDKFRVISKRKSVHIRENSIVWETDTKREEYKNGTYSGMVYLSCGCVAVLDQSAGVTQLMIFSESGLKFLLKFNQLYYRAEEFGDVVVLWGNQNGFSTVALVNPSSGSRKLYPVPNRLISPIY